MEQGIKPPLFDNMLLETNNYHKIREAETTKHGIKGKKIMQQPTIND